MTLLSVSNVFHTTGKKKRKKRKIIDTRNNTPLWEVEGKKKVTGCSRTGERLRAFTVSKIQFKKELTCGNTASIL